MDTDELQKLLLDPETEVNAGTLAGLFGCTTRTVTDLAKREIVSKTGRGKFALMPSVVRYAEHLRETAAGRGADGEIDLATERALLARSQREKLDLDIAIKRGEFVPVMDVLGVVEKEYAVVRERLLGIVGKLADALKPEQANLVADEINEALSELHQPADSGDVAEWARGADRGDEDEGEEGTSPGATS